MTTWHEIPTNPDGSPTGRVLIHSNHVTTTESRRNVHGNQASAAATIDEDFAHARSFARDLVEAINQAKAKMEETSS